MPTVSVLLCLRKLPVPAVSEVLCLRQLPVPAVSVVLCLRQLPVPAVSEVLCLRSCSCLKARSQGVRLAAKDLVSTCRQGFGLNLVPTVPVFADFFCCLHSHFASQFCLPFFCSLRARFGFQRSCTCCPDYFSFFCGLRIVEKVGRRLLASTSTTASQTI